MLFTILSLGGEKVILENVQRDFQAILWNQSG